MKFKISNLLIALIFINMIGSIHSLADLAPFNTIIRLFRLATVPLLIGFIAILLPRQPLAQLRESLLLCLSPIILICVNLLQLFALPDILLPTHATGSARFTTWFLLYIATILALNPVTVNKVKNAIFILLVAIFVIGILQYPRIIVQAGGQIGTALSNYGQVESRYQLAGIFGSANEDANGLITLYPLTLLWIEQQKGLKRTLLRWTLLFYFPLILVFNGTRTALIVSFPLITTLFYWKLSLKQFLLWLGPLAATALLLIQASAGLIERVFGQESQGSGSLGWRIEHAWVPAVDYTWAKAPLFGFGSRGWEYITHQLQIYDIEGMAEPAHSGYVWVFVSWGALGLFAYVTFLGLLLAQAFSLSLSEQTEIALGGRALLCAVIGYCLWAFISNVMWPQGWLILILLATLIACFKILEREENQPALLEPEVLQPT